MWQTLVKIMPDPSGETTLESMIPKVGNSSVLDRKLLKIVSTLSAFVHGTNQVLGNLAPILQGSNDDDLARLTEEVNEVNDFATNMLDELSLQFPKRLVLVKTIKAAEFLLRLERELVKVNSERGLIQHAVTEQVLDIIERTAKRLQQSPFAIITEVQRTLGSEEVVDELENVAVGGLEVPSAPPLAPGVRESRRRTRVSEVDAIFDLTATTPA
jgi:hypothetical protein